MHQLHCEKSLSLRTHQLLSSVEGLGFERPELAAVMDVFIAAAVTVFGS